jgi:hypothetical protein
MSYLSYLYLFTYSGVQYIFTISVGDRHGRERMVVQLPVQSVSISTKVVRSNPVHGEVYSIQHYVIKIVNDLRRSVVFSRYSGFLHQ